MGHYAAEMGYPEKERTLEQRREEIRRDDKIRAHISRAMSASFARWDREIEERKKARIEQQEQERARAEKE